MAEGPGRRHTVALLLGLAVTAAALWLAFRDTDIASVWAAFARADWIYALPLALCYGGSFVVRAQRWRLLLAPMQSVPARTTYGPMILGFFANNILPAHLGEFVRMHLGARRFGMRNSQVLATLIIERLFDFLMVVLILWVALAVTDKVPDGLVQAGNLVGAVAFAGLVALAAFAFWTDAILRLGRGAGFMVPGRLRRALRDQLELAAEGCAAIKRPWLLLPIVVQSLAVWLLIGLAIWSGLLALGVSIPLAAAFVVLLASVLAVALPSAPGFFGAVQLAFTLALKPFGVAAGDALAASFFFHLLTYTLVMAWGFYFMRGLGYSFGRLRREAEQPEA